jgi:hypothetical protein
MRALALGAAVVFSLTGLSSGCSGHRRARAVVAIARAHAVDRHVFSIFPYRVGLRRCAIPEGGLQLRTRRIAGSCATRARVGVRTLVSFTELWPRSCRITRPHRGRCRFHTWRILVGRGGRIIRVRNFGDPAPQFYY